MSYLAGMNPEQLRAATTLSGPLLILAGAGSGKTKVLTARVAHLISNGVDPANILAVTFTNKAAGEMKERVVRLVGEIGERVWMSTFHSTCARILRMEIEALGWTKKFAIYDDDDQLRIVKEIVASFGYDPERVAPRDVLGQIDRHKNLGVGTPDELIQQRRSHVNDPLARIWREYEARLKAADAVDFNDLIRLVVLLWSTRPDILAKWQDRFRYVLVDEYQDTNKGQFQLLRLLTSQHRNLAVVGDDDQSIYGFRGADISNILGFERDYPEAVVVKLEQNYRCTGNILAVANAAVALNTGRMAKRLWTAGDAGQKVGFLALETPREEAQRVASAIIRLRRSGVEPGDVAIIYRTNATSRVFESALRDARIPHRIVGGRRFYEHREIRDVLGYMRLIVNAADDAAFLRIVNVPSRGIGPATLSALRTDATGRGEPLWKTARARASAKEAGGRALSAFVALIDELAEASKTLEPAELVLRVLDRTGYQAGLEAENSPESRDRLENLEELVRDAATFEVDPGTTTPVDRLRGWLDRIALASQDEEIPAGGEVALMTVHNAKGLEYDVVFVVHLMEGNFPHSRSLDEANDVEEERRLAYVAFTRAKKRLILTRSRTAPTNPLDPRSTARLVAPSRFLYGLPEEVCEGDLPEGQPCDPPDQSGGPLPEVARTKLRAFLEQRRSEPRASVSAPRTRDDRPSAAVEVEDASALRPGVEVWHPSRGRGVVRGRGQGVSVLVSFGGGTPVNVPAVGGGLLVVRD